MCRCITRRLAALFCMLFNQTADQPRGKTHLRATGRVSDARKVDIPLAQQLRIPGPTPVPARVVRAASRPMINHRGPEFAALLRDCVRGVQWALQTDNDVLLYGASGTGGLEATAANLLSPGERALFCTSGWFGELWANIAEAFGADVVRLAVPWGQHIAANDVERVLERDPAITKVFVTHNETSTGMRSDIAAIAAVVKARGHLLAVDSVSGAPCHPLPVQELGLDVVITSSQKGWMAPPGLIMIAVSDAALRAATDSACPSWYFDFLRQKSCHDKGLMHVTPPLSIMYSLAEGIAMIREEGLAASWLRHERIASMTRSGLQAAGLELVARGTCVSSTVTAVRSPFDSPEWLAAFLRDLRVYQGLILADGLGSMEGTSFRVGHLGHIVEDDVYAMLASLEEGLARSGMPITRGAAVRAAEQVSVGWSTQSGEPHESVMGTVAVSAPTLRRPVRHKTPRLPIRRYRVRYPT
jgi:aspartate aminotransferase-like enzyme